MLKTDNLGKSSSRLKGRECLLRESVAKISGAFAIEVHVSVAQESQ